MDSWWHTPLCSDFIENIINEITFGKIALVFLPKHTPIGFLSELKDRFYNKGEYHFDRIDISSCNPEDSYPIERHLHSHFDIDNQTDRFVEKTAASLFRFEKYDPHRIFVFEGLQNSLIDHFVDFITSLGRYLISEQNYERHKVLVVINADTIDHQVFISEPGVQKIIFEGVWDKLDNTLGLRYYHKFNNGLNTYLDEKIIGSLSVFDTYIMEHLVDCDNLLSDYQNILIEFANERNWAGIKYIPLEKLKRKEIAERWAIGILEKNHSRYVYHSAFLMVHNRDAEIDKRIWHAGVQVLLPLIEELRDVLLMSDKLTFTNGNIYKKTGEEITDTRDLEIGDIHHFIKTRKIKVRWLSIDEKKKLKDYIGICRQIRNDLSHLKMPSAVVIKNFFENYSEVGKLLKNEN